MRSIHKNFNLAPKEWKRKLGNKLATLIEEGANHKPTKKNYNHALRADLAVYYHDKCGYCEQALGNVQGTENFYSIEHYRPKRGPHSYWWLGYEWTNIFPACQTCNNSKDRDFPLLDEALRRKGPQSSLAQNIDDYLNDQSRKADHDYLLGEQALLLHPEVDSVEDYLAVNFNGMLVPRPKLTDVKTKRAEVTINCLSLNRSSLQEKRKKIIDDFQLQLKNELVKSGFAEPTKAVLESSFFPIYQSLMEGLREIQAFHLVYECIIEEIEAMLFQGIINDLIKDRLPLDEEMKQMLLFFLNRSWELYTEELKQALIP